MDKIELIALMIVVFSIVVLPVGGSYYYEFVYRPAHSDETSLKGITFEGDRLIAYQGAIGWQPSEIRVKKGDTVRLKIMSIDVPHGLAISGYDINTGPIKVGESKTVEFVADKAGKFTYYCSVWCSPKHPFMNGLLIVEDDGETSIEPAIEPKTGIQAGEEVFVAQGCGSCHTVSTISGAIGVIGPDLSTIGTVDRKYLSRAITDPGSDIAEGYTSPSMMPPYKAMSDTELNNLLDFLSSLK